MPETETEDRSPDSAGKEPEIPDSGNGNRPRKALVVLAPIAIGVAALVAIALLVVLTPVRSKNGDEAGANGTPANMGVAEVGSAAPDFTLKTVDGGLFHLADYRGRVVLINFWGTWCQPCEKETPDLVTAFDAQGGVGGDTIFVGIAVNDSPDSVVRFVQQKKVDYPIGLDEGQIAGRYLVAGFPTTVIIDSNGIVREHISRAFPDVAAIDASLAAARAVPSARS